jgi:5-(carboxyamino)imidazole ribonucleotide mutase
MARISVIFGSKSDENVYSLIIDKLKDENLPYEFIICSAHKSPEFLDKVISNTDANVIISGAGLAAHLPGVIASKTLIPVIGVPVEGAFKGLDALLSIIQMPSGIPVLSTGVNNPLLAINSAIMLLREYESVNLINNKKEIIEKTIKVLKDFNVDYTISDNFNKEKINISFVDLNEKEQNISEDYFCINVPFKKETTLTDTLKLYKITKKGLWVGLNMADNAALIAIQIMNINGRFETKLNDFRQELKDKIIHSNEIGF